MKNLYKQAFEQVKMSEEKVNQMQEELLASLEQKQPEKGMMKMKKSFSKTRKVLYPVAMLVLVLSCSAFAYGTEKIQQNVKQVIQLFSGGELTIGTYVETKENGEIAEQATYTASYTGEPYVEEKEDTEMPEDESGEIAEQATYAASYSEAELADNEKNVYKVEDGHVYFIAAGENIDITKKCSDSQYYQYEKVDSDGQKHVLIVGGSLEHLGWAEFIFDKDGKYINNVLSIPVDADGKMYGTWTLQAELDLGIMEKEEYELELAGVR
jgi:hypothetical protein